MKTKSSAIALFNPKPKAKSKWPVILCAIAASSLLAPSLIPDKKEVAQPIVSKAVQKAIAPNGLTKQQEEFLKIAASDTSRNTFEKIIYLRHFVKGWEQYARWAAVSAFILTIYTAEGTRHHETPYQVIYTYQTFEGFEHHPFNHPDNTDDMSVPLPCAVVRGENLCSAASGAGQFMPKTFRGLEHTCPHMPDKNKQGYVAFTPVNQDGGVLCLMNNIGATNALLSGLAIKNGDEITINRENLRRAIHLASAEWASMPNSAGVSAHNQPSKAEEDLIEIFYEELANQDERISKWLFEKYGFAL